MKFVKSLILIASLIAFSSAHAMLGRGPYVGLGGDQFWTEYDLTVQNKANGIKVSHGPTTLNFVGHAFAGYGNTFHYGLAYFGAEVGTYFPTITENLIRRGVALTAQHFQNQLKLQNYFTVDITPGVNLNGYVLLYGRIGYSYAKATISQPAAPGVAAFTRHSNLPGIRLGATADFALGQFCLIRRYLPMSDHFALGFDYVYTNYAQLSTIPLSAFPPVRFNAHPAIQDVGFHLKFTC